MNICIFGDSTAWGAWDLEKGGWVNRLQLFFAENDQDVMLYNLSISGGTTETILNRFESEAKIRNAEVIIFQSGGNDASLEHESNDCCIPPEKFKANLEEIIKRAKKIVGKVFFIGFENVDETKTKPVSWANISYLNTNIRKYNEIMNEVCTANEIPFLSTLGTLTNDDLDDGVHPNATGHKKLFQAIKDFLVVNKIVS